MLFPLWPVSSPGEGPSRAGVGPVGSGKPLGKDSRMPKGTAQREGGGAPLRQEAASEREPFTLHQSSSDEKPQDGVSCGELRLQLFL